MTREELDSFQQFRDLDEYDGNNLDINPPQQPAGHVVNSAMSVEEAHFFLARPQCTPQYIERHTGDDGTVGYEVIFWENQRP
jgi:hypothetical protein